MFRELVAATVLIGSLCAGAPSFAQRTQPTPAQAKAEPTDYSKLSFNEKSALARNDDVGAQISLAKDYLSGENGAKKRPVNAARWLTNASKLGSMEAQFMLADLLWDGATGLQANRKNAVTLYASAADNGHIEAAYRAAHAYHYGEGAEKDSSKAVKYYTLAADKGHVESKNNLGLLYLQGSGTFRDLTVAFGLFEDSAKAGNAWGQNNLGGMYEMGWGTAKDLSKALALYEKSAAAGNRHGSDNLVRLEAVMKNSAPTETETIEKPATEVGPADTPKAETVPQAENSATPSTN